MSNKTIEVKNNKLIIVAILGIAVIIASVMIYKFVLPDFMLPNL